MPAPKPLGLPIFLWRLLLAAAIVAVFMLTRASAADCPCTPPVRVVPIVAQPPRDSWIFMPSRYTHDPATGARVAQYSMKPAIEPLDDPRAVTSGYSRSRTVMQGADGSSSTYYRVQSFGNGRGGLDAEWERFHDAWRGSTTSGGQGYYSPYGYGGYGYGPYAGYGNSGYPPYGANPYAASPYAASRAVPGPGAPAYGVAPQAPNGYGGVPGFNSNGGVYGFGPGYGQPDAGRLDPDGADGYHEQIPRTPDRDFFLPGLPPFTRQHNPNQHHHNQHP
jgi:hypothetical protein